MDFHVLCIIKIVPFRDNLSLCFMRNFENKAVGRTHFHMNGFGTNICLNAKEQINSEMVCWRNVCKSLAAGLAFPNLQGRGVGSFLVPCLLPLWTSHTRTLFVTFVLNLFSNYHFEVCRFLQMRGQCFCYLYQNLILKTGLCANSLKKKSGMKYFLNFTF